MFTCVFPARKEPRPQVTAFDGVHRTDNWAVVAGDVRASLTLLAGGKRAA